MTRPAHRLAALLVALQVASACSAAAAQGPACRDPAQCCPSTVVPPLVGQRADEALRLNRERGLLSTTTLTRARPGTAAGRVYASLPRPGARVCLDTPVTVFVARAPTARPHALLPDTVGQRLADALRQLQQARVRVQVQPLCGAAPDPARSRVVLQRVALPRDRGQHGTAATPGVELVTEHDADLPPLRGLPTTRALEALNAAPGPRWRLCTAGTAGTDGCAAPASEAILLGVDRIDRRACRIDAEFNADADAVAVAAPAPGASPAEPAGPSASGSATVPLAGGAALLGGTAALAALKLARTGLPGSPSSSSNNAPPPGAPGTTPAAGAGLRLRVRRDVDDTP